MKDSKKLFLLIKSSWQLFCLGYNHATKYCRTQTKGFLNFLFCLFSIIAK